jgi:uncharacterized membrane protein YfcA
MQELLFYIVLPPTAFLYASVGHGGASGYLALMALFSFAPEEMRPTALVLNLFVAGVSFMQFARQSHFQLKLFLIFAILSIPASFLGGSLCIDPKWYKIILGGFLLIATARMLGVFGAEKQTERNVLLPLGIMIGAGIGFFSGLIGIGGGIILSPVILLLGWGNAKQAAATSALFIWVNSASGLMGQWSSGVTFSDELWLLVGLAIIGGFTGAYFGSKVLNDKKLRFVLGFVLVLASLKLFFI